jgi:hypothetical protein
MKRLIHIIIFVLTGLLAIWSGCENYTDDYPVPDASLAPIISYEPAKNISPGNPITFTNKTVVPNNMGDPVFYWNFGDGTDTTIENINQTIVSTDLVKQYYNEVQHTYSDTGKYSVTFKVLTASGDSAMLTEKLTVEYLLLGDTIFTQTFEGISLIPDTWNLVNVDGNNPSSSFSPNFADSAWAVRYSSYFESQIAEAISYYDPESYADDWMILPNVSIGDSSAVRWDAMSLTGSGDYPDDYGVYISTTDQTVAACENNLLLKINAESWGTDATTPGEGIKARRVFLHKHGYKNQTVHIAFRLMTPSPGGSSLGIDNIHIINLQDN